MLIFCNSSRTNFDPRPLLVVIATSIDSSSSVDAPSTRHVVDVERVGIARGHRREDRKNRKAFHEMAREIDNQ